MAQNEVKERIFVILKKHPEGLTISQIAKEVGMHRHSIVKYVYELTGEKKIIQRKIGPATLCYIYKKNYEKSFTLIPLLVGISITMLFFQMPILMPGIMLFAERKTTNKYSIKNKFKPQKIFSADISLS